MAAIRLIRLVEFSYTIIWYDYQTDFNRLTSSAIRLFDTTIKPKDSNVFSYTLFDTTIKLQFSYTIIWYDYQTSAGNAISNTLFSYTIIWYDYQTRQWLHLLRRRFSYTIIWYDYQTVLLAVENVGMFSYTIIWYDYQTRPRGQLQGHSFSYTIIWYDYQTSNWLERILCSLRQWPQNTYNLLLLSYHKMPLISRTDQRRQ